MAGKSAASPKFKLPPLRKSGEYEEDSRREATRSCLMSIIETCLDDESHVLPLYNELQKRINAAKANPTTKLGKDLAFTPPVQTLRQLPASFVCGWLVECTGLSPEVLAKVYEFDAEAPGRMLEFLCQLPASLKIPPEGNIKAVMTALLNHRVAACGNRGTKMKEAVAATGQIQWSKFGSYELKLDQHGVATGITYVGGAQQHFPAGISVDKSWNLCKNWSDDHAYVEKPPFPPVVLSQFFAKDADRSPGTIIRYKTNCEAWRAFIQRLQDEWVGKQSEVQGGKAASSQAVTAELGKIDASKKREASEKAKAAAAEALARKRAKTSIQVGS